MGLIKKDGALIKGVMIKPAYAKIWIFKTYKNEQKEDVAYVMFGISSSRENLDNEVILTTETMETTFNRASGDLFNELYTKAKENIFQGWEDDIVNGGE